INLFTCYSILRYITCVIIINISNNQYCLLPFAEIRNVTYVNRRLRMTLTKIIRYLSDNYCHVDRLDRDKCYVFTDMLIKLHKVLHDHFQFSGIVYRESCQFRTRNRLLRFFLTSRSKIKMAIFGKIPVLLDSECLYILLRA
ncbi:hypothetical protein ALC53_02996, partial [Atta colombica]